MHFLRNTFIRNMFFRQTTIYFMMHLSFMTVLCLTVLLKRSIIFPDNKTVLDTSDLCNTRCYIGTTKCNGHLIIISSSEA